MKRLLIIILTLLALPAELYSQSVMKEIFGGKYSSDPNVTETLITGQQPFLSSHRLTTLATFRGDPQTYESIIEPIVAADGANAIARDVRYRNGKLQYAYFILPPVKKDGKAINRYLYYLNNEKAKRPSVMVIYFEGPIRNTDASKFIKSLAGSR
ncbi:MAG: hypothetical protein K2K65_02760 [Duncaniella sp.]|nr:hypothetical protein [Duncaniella sp.]